MTYAGLFEKCKTIDDARALKKKLIAEASDNFRRMQELEIEQAYRKRREELRNAILSAPEVTTCKGCKYHEEAEGGYEYCHKWLRETYGDWHCSRGEQDE